MTPSEWQKFAQLVDILYEIVASHGYELPYLEKFSILVKSKSVLLDKTISEFDKIRFRMQRLSDSERRKLAIVTPKTGELIKMIEPLPPKELPEFMELIFFLAGEQNKLVSAISVFATMANNAVHYTLEAPKELCIKSLLKENLSDTAICLLFVGHLYERMLFVWLNQHVFQRRLWIKDDYLFPTDEIILVIQALNPTQSEFLYASYLELGWITNDRFKEVLGVVKDMPKHTL